jgi:tRNA uridine 5-carbamoylmethylation protein Kti12
MLKNVIITGLSHSGKKTVCKILLEILHENGLIKKIPEIEKDIILPEFKLRIYIRNIEDAETMLKDSSCTYMVLLVFSSRSERIHRIEKNTNKDYIKHYSFFQSESELDKGPKITRENFSELKSRGFVIIKNEDNAQHEIRISLEEFLNEFMDLIYNR